MADKQFVSITNFLQEILTFCDTPIYYLMLKFSQPLPESSIFSSIQLLGFLFQSSCTFLSTLAKAVPQLRHLHSSIVQPKLCCSSVKNEIIKMRNMKEEA